MTTGVVLADTTGCIVAGDDGATAPIGRPASTAVGAPFDLMVPPHRARRWAASRRAMATGECGLHVAATNLPVLLAGGREEPLAARCVFLTGARDRVAGAGAVSASPAGGEVASEDVLGDGPRDQDGGP